MGMEGAWEVAGGGALLFKTPGCQRPDFEVLFQADNSLTEVGERHPVWSQVMLWNRLA